MNIYLIKSFSIRLLNEELAKITMGAANIVRMNMEESSIEDVLSECSYYSLLNEHKFVIVDNFKVGKENSKIEEYINNPNPDATLILITDNIDKRSTVYKIINTKGNIILIEEIKDISNKINSYCKNNDIAIDYLAINKLLENNLDNYDLVLNEIDKISIATKKITVLEAQKYSSKLIKDENFGFCDAVISKDFKKLENYFNEFVLLKQETAPFISLLAGQYRLMYSIKFLAGSSEEIAKTLEVHPYRIKLAKEKSLNYSLKELEKKLLDLCDLDYKTKTTNIDKYLLLKIFLFNI